jgi:hypothetical protein
MAAIDRLHIDPMFRTPLLELCVRVLCTEYGSIIYEVMIEDRIVLRPPCHTAAAQRLTSDELARHRIVIDPTSKQHG